jgi:signal transduction histidine kinase
MTPIKGYVEFLLMGGAGDLNEQQKQFLDIIKSNIDRLAILVNDLLDVSRIEAGKVALSFQPVDMAEAITEVARDVQQKYADEGKVLDYRLEASPSLPNVYGDVDRIRQILGNLIDNAYRYSPPGTSIEISVRRQGDELQVDVQDQGIGIFPDDQDRIFERFYRGENQLVMETAGTGLGLPIVKELVEMHNGRLWVESEGIPGKGSTFSFTLPIYMPEREMATQSLKEE